MRSLLLTLLACALFTSMQGCATKGTPISPLGTPQFVPQSQPDSLVETGIRQDPNTGGMFLQWYAMPSAAGYRIYRSDTANHSGTPIQFTLVGNVISSTVLNDTSMIDLASIQTGTKYYYYFRAYASDGSLSPPSDTINYTLIPQTGLSYPAANALVDQSGLHFGWVNSVSGGGYTVVRVRDVSMVPNVTVWVSARFQTFDQYPSKPFDFDSTATQQLISGHSYQWRVERFDIDGTGRPYEGSTSPWSTFTVK